MSQIPMYNIYNLEGVNKEFPSFQVTFFLKIKLKGNVQVNRSRLD